MPRISVRVGSSIGLHARPASLIAEAAATLDAHVTLAVPGGEPVDADSALLIMTLGATNGDEVLVTSEDDSAAQTIAELVAADLDV